MTITKLKTRGPWGSVTYDLTQVGTHLGGRRVITGMLTGPNAPIEPPPAPAFAARIPGTRPPTSK